MRKLQTRRRGKCGRCGWLVLMWLALGDPQHLWFWLISWRSGSIPVILPNAFSVNQSIWCRCGGDCMCECVKLARRFGFFFYFFLLEGWERGVRGATRREGDGFFIENPSGGGGFSQAGGGGGEGPGGCFFHIWGGRGLIFFFRGRNSPQESILSLSMAEIETMDIPKCLRAMLKSLQLMPRTSSNVLKGKNKFITITGDFSRQALQITSTVCKQGAFRVHTKRVVPQRALLRRVLETAFEKVLRRVLRRCLVVASCMGGRVLRRGSKKGLSRRHLESRNTPSREYDPLGVRPSIVTGEAQKGAQYWRFSSLGGGTFSGALVLCQYGML